MNTLKCADEGSFQQKRRYFIQTKTGTMIAVDQIQRYYWHENNECYVVRLVGAPATEQPHMVEEGEMQKIGAVR